MNEQETTSKLEKWLLFLLPLIFTAILLVILLAIFNKDFRQNLTATASHIPVVKNWVAEEKKTPVVDKQKEMQKELEQLKKIIARKDQEAQNMKNERLKLVNKRNELENDLSNLKSQQKEESIQMQEYTEHLKETANMYAKMSPGKAAAMVETLALEERTLIFSFMKPNDRVKILEKMKPKLAAELTMHLKETKSVDDLAISALQARLKTQPLQSSEIIQNTFSAMGAKQAAELILQMSEVKQLQILNSVDDDTRSKVLSEMTNISKNKAAQLISKMVSEKR